MSRTHILVTISQGNASVMHVLSLPEPEATPMGDSSAASSPAP